jgi:hypothetical protein
MISDRAHLRPWRRRCSQFDGAFKAAIKVRWRRPELRMAGTREMIPSCLLLQVALSHHDEYRSPPRHLHAQHLLYFFFFFIIWILLPKRKKK